MEQGAPALAAQAAQVAYADSADVLVAYYFHRTLRCETCILMEQYVKDVIADEFAAEEAQGRLHFKAFDYEDPANLDLVEAYRLGDGPVLLLSKQRQGEELDHKELSAIWDRMEAPLGLLDLLRVEIAAALDTLGHSARVPPAESQTESSARPEDPSGRATRGSR